MEGLLVLLHMRTKSEVITGASEMMMLFHTIILLIAACAVGAKFCCMYIQ